MKTNMGIVDRLIRILVALVIIDLYAIGFISEAYNIGLFAIAGIFLATSLIGFCPLYFILGLTQRGKLNHH